MTDLESGASPEGKAEVEADVGPARPGARETLRAIAAAVAVAVLMAFASAVAFDPGGAGKATGLLVLTAANAVLAGFAIVRLQRRGELSSAFHPVGGDLTLGAASAGLLYGLAHLAQQYFARRGTPYEAWLWRIYLQIGDADAPGRRLFGLWVFVVAALEEVVWRGLVLHMVGQVLGVGRALVLTVALFTLAHAPSAFLLRDPVVGPNPLVLLAAVGGGVLWGGITLRARRLIPAIFSHALFTWAMVEFPIWRP